MQGLLLCAASLFVLSCNLAQTNRPPVFSGIGWATSNYDPSFWTKTGGTAPATGFRCFQVFIDDPDVRQDIVEITVSDPLGQSWSLEDDYDSESGYWGGYFYYSSSSPDRIELGTYEVLARDSAGHEISSTFAVNRPGEVSGTGFLFSPDYGGIKTGGDPMLARAFDLSGSKTAGDLTVSFKVNDSRVYNGWVWFYDAAGGYIGYSDWFKDTINGGSGLHTDGITANSLVLTAADLTGFFDSIAGFHVVLTDGAQLAPEINYDHRSISAYAEF